VERGGREEGRERDGEEEWFGRIRGVVGGDVEQRR
jgi:hypothetical protein